MGRIIATVAVAIVITLGVLIGTRLSSDSIALLVGVLIGIMASIPTGFLFAWALSRRNEQQARTPMGNSQYPPVVVVNPGAGMPWGQPVQAPVAALPASGGPSFDTVSKLWRFAGYAVIDGQSEKNAKGEKSHFNRRLKSTCFLVADQFIRQQTPGYIEIYYAEKERQHRLHPEPVENGNGKKIYTDAHLHNRAWRKMVKIFLQHLWLTWRQSEGLPVSEPYVQAIMGHTNIVKP